MPLQHRSNSFYSKFLTEASRLGAAEFPTPPFRRALAFHTIAKIEAGATPKPTIETVKKIADALGVSLDDLIK